MRTAALPISLANFESSFLSKDTLSIMTSIPVLISSITINKINEDTNSIFSTVVSPYKTQQESI